MSNLNSIKKYIKYNNLDAYIIPKNDEFFQEFSQKNTLRTVTNFTGSAGSALITKKQNFLFVDGRYAIQAVKECGLKFKINIVPKNTIKKLIGSNKTKIKIGYSPKLFTRFNLENKFGSNCKLIPCNESIINENKNTKQFYSLNESITGEKYNKKILRLMKIISNKNLDNIYISSPENVAWLLNIRGYDNPYSPIPNCQIIINKKKIYFFSKEKSWKTLKKEKILKNIYYFKKKEFFNVIKQIEGSSFFLDRQSCSIYDEGLIKSKFKVKYGDDPCYLLKSIKNTTEIEHVKKAHFYDGLAFTKFIFFLKNSKKKFDEVYLEKKLEVLKRKNKKYLYPSFKTISGTGPNSSIIHYNSNESTNKIVKKDEIYLCDSGGQYKYGTTDATRTVCFSKPSQKIKNIFTRVLKGHIAVVTSNIKKKTNGAILDQKARFWLKQIKLDYPHGTGHGVGFFLNVHEGPQSISRYNKTKLEQGMILSNEPGYYKKNKFGIRIENLIYLKKHNSKLIFDNLTFIPLDIDLINLKMLSKFEATYLKKYHQKIYNLFKTKLNIIEKKWILNLINHF